MEKEKKKKKQVETITKKNKRTGKYYEREVESSSSRPFVSKNRNYEDVLDQDLYRSNSPEPKPIKTLQNEYPTKENKTKQLILKDIEGELDLSEFNYLENLSISSSRKLTRLDVSNNSLLKFISFDNTSISEINLSSNINLSRICIINNDKLIKIIFPQESSKLERMSLFRNRLRMDLDEFSHLTQLKHLDLGTEKLKDGERYNDISGSLKSLENCEQLEYLCIGQNPKIDRGLDSKFFSHLPLDKLVYFGCQGTAFKELLKPFDYDVEAWKLINCPEKATRSYDYEGFVDKEELIYLLNKKIKQAREKINSFGQGKGFDYYKTYPFILDNTNPVFLDASKQRIRLINKIKILEQELQRISPSLESKVEQLKLD